MAKDIAVLRDRKLTRKQQRFVDELTSQDGLITGTQAAINAGFATTSAYQRAHEMQNPRLMPHVCAALEARRDEQDAMHAVTAKRHVRALAELRNAALANNAFSAAVMAEYRRGQVEGLYVSRSEMRVGTIDSLTREEVQLELQRIRSTFERDVIDISPSSEEADEADRGKSLEFLASSAGDDAETNTADAD
mgnify:FL=1